MISLAKIRLTVKQAIIDPRKPGTEFHVSARDMTAMAHYKRAQELLSHFIEGIKPEPILFVAIWHLACGLTKNGILYSPR